MQVSKKEEECISELVRPDGSGITYENDLGQMAKNFYQLYSPEGVDGMDEVLRCVPKKVGTEMNCQLGAPFDGREIKKALFEMYPIKTPGPDGFPACSSMPNLGCVR
jgi:hypothetical protein